LALVQLCHPKDSLNISTNKSAVGMMEFELKAMNSESLLS
jgi:hypothetical protein